MTAPTLSLLDRLTADRVPAKCGHTMTKAEKAAGYSDCERCGVYSKPDARLVVAKAARS